MLKTNHTHDATEVQTATREQYGNRCVKRPFAVIFSFLFWCGALLLPILYAIFGTKEEILIPVAGVTGMFWIAHAVQFGMSSTKKYLNRVQSTESAYAYVDRTYTTRDSQGRTRTTTRQEKVVTYTAKLEFVYDSCSDVSGELTGLEGHSIAKLDLSKSLVFADAATQSLYEATRDEFFKSNKYRDNHMSTLEQMSVPGFHAKVNNFELGGETKSWKMLSLVDPHKRPALLHYGWYSLSMILVLSVPYRWWFDSVTSRVSFDIKKSIKCESV